MSEGFFWGFKFSILVFFCKKIWQVFFGWLDLRREFWGTQNVLGLLVSRVLLERPPDVDGMMNKQKQTFGIFLSLRNSAWHFLGLIFL